MNNNHNDDNNEKEAAIHFHPLNVAIKRDWYIIFSLRQMK